MGESKPLRLEMGYPAISCSRRRPMSRAPSEEVSWLMPCWPRCLASTILLISEQVFEIMSGERVGIFLAIAMHSCVTHGKETV